MKIVRSDRYHINTTPESALALTGTLSMYRKYVRAVMTVISTHWPTMGSTQGNDIVRLVEGLIHPTNKRPDVRYQYFQKRFYKFPSYLRRVAIMDAAGQVRSFHTRYSDWLDGKRKHPNARPPTLTVSTQTFPSLYQGQCIKYSGCGNKILIKVFYKNDWVWQDFQVKGKPRFATLGKAMSPLLVFTGKRWQLSRPVKLDIPLRKPNDYSGRVLSIDVGINTAATAAVVDRHGTVLDRKFLHRSDKDREHQLMQRIRRKARKQTRHGNRLPTGFAKNEHRRLKQLMNNASHQLSREIVNIAKLNNCDAIVVERLKGFRPKKGAKRSTLKSKFHRWFHRQLVDRVMSKAHEIGVRLTEVFAAYTSAFAFDGSGKVNRSKTNAALCQFQSGKHYNADLNAAYNIAARGILRLYYPKLREQLWSSGKPMTCPATGNPWTLSSVWRIAQA
jgi:putative transposase